MNDGRMSPPSAPQGPAEVFRGSGLSIDAILMGVDTHPATTQEQTGGQMRQVNRPSEVAGPRAAAPRAFLSRTRWAVVGMILGLLAGIWVGGGTDRYGEDEGVLGGIRGGRRTFARGYRYMAATIRELLTNDQSSVRNLGLGRQVEIRLWQDKRLAAEAIVVEVEEAGRVVLTGQVPDAADKEKAVTLARDTRGVETVVDQLAVATASRTIEASPSPSPAVPTGVASGVRILR